MQVGIVDAIHPRGAVGRIDARLFLICAHNPVPASAWPVCC
jgi:hypothetical protein